QRPRSSAAPPNSETSSARTSSISGSSKLPVSTITYSSGSSHRSTTAMARDPLSSIQRTTPSSPPRSSAWTPGSKTGANGSETSTTNSDPHAPTAARVGDSASATGSKVDSSSTSTISLTIAGASGAATSTSSRVTSSAQKKGSVQSVRSTTRASSSPAPASARTARKTRSVS